MCTAPPGGASVTEHWCILGTVLNIKEDIYIHLCYTILFQKKVFEHSNMNILEIFQHGIFSEKKTCLNNGGRVRKAKVVSVFLRVWRCSLTKIQIYGRTWREQTKIHRFSTSKCGVLAILALGTTSHKEWDNQQTTQCYAMWIFNSKGWDSANNRDSTRFKQGFRSSQAISVDIQHYLQQPWG